MRKLGSNNKLPTEVHSYPEFNSDFFRGTQEGETQIPRTHAPTRYLKTVEERRLTDRQRVYQNGIQNNYHVVFVLSVIKQRPVIWSLRKAWGSKHRTYIKLTLKLILYNKELSMMWVISPSLVDYYIVKNFGLKI